MIHPDIETTILIGYPTIEHVDYEKELSCHDPLVKTEYDDANTLLETLEEEI